MKKYQNVEKVLIQGHQNYHFQQETLNKILINSHKKFYQDYHLYN